MDLNATKVLSLSIKVFEFEFSFFLSLSESLYSLSAQCLVFHLSTAVIVIGMPWSVTRLTFSHF